MPHFSMKVYRRLQKLLLCVSHQHSLRCIDELGEGYDDEVMEWKRELENDFISEVAIYT